MNRTERIVACPLVRRRGRLHVVLVTGRRYHNWLLPKGRREDDLTRREVAELEAWEEAGVVGSAFGQPSRFRMVAHGGGHRAMLAYGIHVRRLARIWPEQHQRQRVLVQVDQLDRIPITESLRRCITRLVGQV